MNYLFVVTKSLYLKPVNLQKCENLWMEAYFYGSLWVWKDFLTVYVN